MVHPSFITTKVMKLIIFYMMAIQGYSHHAILTRLENVLKVDSSMCLILVINLMWMILSMQGLIQDLLLLPCLLEW